MSSSPCLFAAVVAPPSIYNPPSGTTPNPSLYWGDAVFGKDQIWDEHYKLRNQITELTINVK
ncbi:hypothetical protein L195_g052034 [Trifolium pratense]|uniref:Uncharacterized protein n=1 Tax=Trifolium pratense TaxID=57577 RepID=A0A2K3K316_TRIPR|nr:hypothetical protein L195_g052034 [Trifolium pratense]